MTSKRIAALVGTGALMSLAGVGAAVAVEPDDSTTIHACMVNGSGSLRAVDAPEQCRTNETALSWNEIGPQGPQGEQGPQGPAGGVKGYELRSTSTAVARGLGVVAVQCPSGKHATGGGYRFNPVVDGPFGSVRQDVHVEASFPTGSGNIWRVTFRHLGPGTVEIPVTVHAVCADVS